MDVFEGISFENLENLDSDKLKLESFEVDTESVDDKPKNKKNQVKTDEEELDLPEGFDLDEIANLGNEEEEDTDPKGTTETPDDGETKKSSHEEVYTSLASALSESGVLSSLDEEELKEITDSTKLLEAIGKQIKKNEFTDLTEDQKKYLEALRAGVPHETFSKSKTQIEEYNRCTDDKITSNKTLQFELIKRSFLIKGIDITTSEKYARRAIESEDAVEDAINAKNALVAYEEDKLQAELDEKEQAKAKTAAAEQEKLNSLKAKLDTVSEIIPGLKIQSTTKEKIFASITGPVKKDGENLLNDVMDKYKNDPEYLIKLHTMHVVTNGFTDFSKFTKTAKSNAIKDLDEKLKNPSFATGFGGDSGRSPGATKMSEALKGLRI